MRFIRIILLLLAVLLPVTATAQSVVRGIITDSSTGQPMPGVHIISGPGQGTLSGTNGEFAIAPGQGTTVITFRFVGYKAERREINTTQGDTLVVDIAMVPDVTNINEIVISASRSEQKLSELTVSMSVIKPSVINRNHIENAIELLNRTPGVEVLDGQASIRGGSGYSYGAGSRVMALIDGLPALSADAGNIKWNSLPLENISRIEIIKGASSVLYGSSAMNGVINFISREPTEVPYTQVVLSSSVFGKTPNPEWQWWSSPRLNMMGSLSHSQIRERTGISVGMKLFTSNGYRKLNDETYGRINLKLKQTSAKNRYLTYGANFYSTFTSKIDFLLWEDATQGGLRQNPATALDSRNTSLALDPFVTFGNGKVKHSITGRYMVNINNLPENKNNNSNSQSVYTEYQFTSNNSGIISMISGITQQYNYIGSNFYGDHTGLNIAGYTQFEARPLTWLRGVAGVRLEEYILDGKAEKLIPIFRAGVNLTLAPSTFLRASVGQGYRYPAVAEKFAYTTVGSVRIIPNDEIKSESGWSSEVGLKQGFSFGSFSGQGDVALFYSQNKDLIEFVFGYWYDPFEDNYTYGFRPTNIENSRVYGAEAELMLNHTIGGLTNTLTAGYTYMYPVEFNAVSGENTGKFLKYRRKSSVDLGLASSYGRFETGINLYGRSKMLDIDDVFLTPPFSDTILPGFPAYWETHNKSYWVIDFFVGYRMGSNYNLSAGVKNITNTEYMGRPGDVRPHRQFTLQFTGIF